MIKLNILIDKLIWLFTLILFSSFYIFEMNRYSRFILLGITIIIFFLILIRYGLKIHFYWHSFHTCVLLFALFCLISCFWSIDVTTSLIQSAIIFQLLICMSVLYLYYVRQKNIDLLLDVIMWGGYLITIYSFYFYGISNISYLISSAKRLTQDYANINTIGLIATFSTIITFYRVLFNKFKLEYVMVVLNIILIALTGSRKALVILVLGISILFFLKYTKRNWLLSFIKYVLIGIILFFVFKLLLELPIFNVLNHRMETLFNLFSGDGLVDESTYFRQQMIRIGWQSFLDNPFFGLGIGSSGEILASTIGWRSYLHNNYVELLSGIGLVGTCIYYFMFVLPAIKLFKQRCIENQVSILCLVLIFLLLLKDIGSVSYYDKTTFFYIMIFFVQVKINNINLIGCRK